MWAAGIGEEDSRRARQKREQLVDVATLVEDVRGENRSHGARWTSSSASSSATTPSPAQVVAPRVLREQLDRLRRPVRREHVRTPERRGERRNASPQPSSTTRGALYVALGDRPREGERRSSRARPSTGGTPRARTRPRPAAPRRRRGRAAMSCQRPVRGAPRRGRGRPHVRAEGVIRAHSRCATGAADPQACTGFETDMPL